MKKILLLAVASLLLANCSTQQTVAKKSETKAPFVWENANVYFLLIDRFKNGNPNNDKIINRNQPTGKLRDFEGGDLRGVIQKIDEGYFDKLGITAIWITPVVEQIHGCVDEGTGNTYGFHGYWTKDWTAIDPSYGTSADLKELVDKAHKRGIRILLDAVINHTGPVTDLDPVYPSDWVRTSPKCTYQSYDTYINCTLVENLPDVKTESDEAVELPPMLVDKWKAEGRYEQEVAELDAFFAKTGYPRAPRYYIMKWLADYITDYGIDGYRADTVKHTYENVWEDFQKVCNLTFEEYKMANPGKALDSNSFFTVGEVYGYNIGGKRFYDFGDRKVDYFANGFNALINFDFRNEAKMKYEALFSKYNDILHNDLKGYSVMNYVSSHDDGYPYDKKREKPIESGTKLLLAPGISQVYYGDESARSLDIPGTEGDATLRSFMNWDAVQNNLVTKEVLAHWSKLGNFRKNHPAVGGGVHELISSSPYVFSRTYSKNNFTDKVVVGLELSKGNKVITTGKAFANGVKVRDAYSGKTAVVNDGKVTIDTDFDILLLEKL
ncbi:alpha-amylase family glycosyl hydrolase [Flavobacterium capsici]|uniref:Alpha-amylase family glycosyl hydrolase n=1 Tax=Flavobacterium capsici TaxID=3075618 RepID=A0AA96F2G0_9FLAO|nr:MULTISPECIES: alpha-amylase family glycosyl hydrolase [unclassified Flavobacterium]WNM19951.1 alpha-amylase family glycosyl hydrolase [Flavobacterium sp. PMR2A8]WNM21340.1 alpha-amylase family glycosyl hydrolase [Flavobacterium sp. PMTSA4]